MQMAEKIIKIFIKILILLIVLLVIVGVIGVFYVKNKLSKINYVPLEKEKIEINEGVEENLKGYRNIAILGVDSRADSYSNTRSDCIIIVSINQETNDVKLMSVYRDTYVNIDGRGLDKITHAYAFGGPQLALSTINKNLDLNITEFVAVNFEAVVEIINALGGVEIEIIPDELNYINDYISGIDSQEGTSTTKITKSGKQNLNGVQALAYSRIRYTSGGDYKRTERMRDVLIATFEKVKTLSVADLNKIVDIALPKVYTNIKTSEIVSLIPQATKYKVVTSIGWPYEVKGATINGVWYGIPVTLESSVVRMHQEIFGEEDYTVSENVKEISQSIINKAGK